MKYAIIAAIALVVAVMILVVVKLKERKRRKRNSQQYVQLLSNYRNEKSVADSLNEIKDCFKRGSAEYIAIDKAYLYLTQSILRDYSTAFSIVEKVFGEHEVKQLHNEIVEYEKENIMLLLQQPKN